MSELGEAWEVRLCGPLHIEVDGSRIEDRLPGRQGRLLFAYLLEHRLRSCSRVELLELLWPERPPSTSEAALSALLSKVRRALGDGVLAGRAELRLVLPERTRIDTEQAEADVAAAESALAAGDGAQAESLARRALDVDLLAYLPGLDASWTQERRRSLEALRLRALEVVAGAGLLLGGGALAGAEQAARAAVAGAPYRESTHKLLMQVLAATGNEAEALRTFERLRELLEEELGVPPGPAITALHDRLLRGGAAPVAVVERRAGLDKPSALPAPLQLACERHAFVGREVDLLQLGTALDETRDGARQLVFVSGDPGIGKSRLVAEAAARAHADGARVLHGRCDEDSIGPYQPFVELLRGVGPELPGCFERLGARGIELARLMPDVVPAGVPQDPVRDADAQRFRLFSGVVSLLALVGADQPLVIVLDDLHWADRPTLQLLRHLARATSPERLLVLATYRETELAPDHPLPVLVADLERDGAAERLALDGLVGSDVAALVEVLADRPADAAFLRSLQEETEGNPFFIEEVVRSVGSSGVPDGVREMLGRRLRRLGGQARTAMGVAAVMGREFDFDVLEAAGPVRGDALFGALEEALDARVIRELPARPGRYAFAHALIRQAIQQDLSGPRRARIHARVGDALVKLRARRVEDHLGQIARHFAESATATDAERAVEWAVRAARRAEELVAHEEAVEHYRRALVAAERSPIRDERRRGELLVALGSALQRSGDEEDEQVFLQGAAAARRAGDAALLARAALGYAGPWNQLGLVRQDRVNILQEALKEVGDQDEPLRARLLARLTMELYYSGTPQQRLALSADALAIARRVGDRALLASCLDARHYALWRPENAEERLLVAHEACELAEAVGDRERLLESLGWSVVDYLELGDVASVDRQIERACVLAESAHLPLYLWWTALFRSMRAQLEGDFEEAEKLALEALTIGQRGHPENAVTGFGMQLYNIRREQGRIEEVLDPVRTFVANYPAVPAWRALLTHAYVELGRTGEARAELDRLVGSVGGLRALPWDANWLICVTLLAEVCCALRDGERCAELYELLLPYERSNVVVGRAASCNGAAARLLGMLAAASGRWDVAEAHFESALAVHERMGALPWVVRTQVAWAEMLLTRAGEGDGEKAAALLSAASGTAGRLGMVSVAGRIAELDGRRPTAASAA